MSKSKYKIRYYFINNTSTFTYKCF